MTGSGTPESYSRYSWDWWIDRIADVPWGVILAVAGTAMIVFSKPADRGQALLTAAGLFGIGHGIHTAGKRRTQPPVQRQDIRRAPGDDEHDQVLDG